MKRKGPDEASAPPPPPSERRRSARTSASSSSSSSSSSSATDSSSSSRRSSSLPVGSSLADASHTAAASTTTPTASAAATAAAEEAPALVHSSSHALEPAAKRPKLHHHSPSSTTTTTTTTSSSSSSSSASCSRSTTMQDPSNGSDNAASSSTGGSSGATTNGNCSRDAAREHDEHHSAMDTERVLADGFRVSEIVRLMVQTMRELGYVESAALLEKESHTPLQESGVLEFQAALLDGRWRTVHRLLPALRLSSPDHTKEVKFLVGEQMFFELLDSGDTASALTCLRSTLTPLKVDSSRLHRLASMLMCRTSAELRARAQWPGGTESRQNLLCKLREHICPASLAPENRLQALLAQAKQQQFARCLYHNLDDDHVPFSLLQDHACPRTLLPSECVQVLEVHKDEIWHLQFSHSGTMLASSSKDNTAAIWALEADEHDSTSHNGHADDSAVAESKSVHQSFRLRFTLEDHSEALSIVSWSPDDSMLLTAGLGHCIRLWNTRDGSCIKSFMHHSLPVVAAIAWMPDSKRFISGGQDRHIYMMGIDGQQIRTWPCPRVSDLIVSPDGKHMVVSCEECVLKIYNLESSSTEPESIITERETIHSLAFSRDCRHILVGIVTKEVILWDLAQKKVVQKYFRGSDKARFVIRPCFGGADERFVASGSEDSQVYIWHRASGELVNVLPGHSGTINCVSWCPTDPGLLASASDDQTIRLWRATASQHQHQTQRPASLIL